MALAAALILATAGCGSSLLAPNPVNLANPLPAVTEEQVDDIMTATGEVLATADATHDDAGATALAGRLSGPALTIRGAEYVKINSGQTNAQGNSEKFTELPMVRSSAVLPQTDVWPRTFVVFTAPAQDVSGSRALIFHQESSRSQYTLWGWAQLYGGTSVPGVAEYQTGVEVLSNTDATVSMSPIDALAQYVGLLTNGDQSEYAAAFAAGDKALQRVQEIRATNDQLQGDAATYEFSFAPGEPLAAFRTADGGALVVGALTGKAVTTASGGGRLGSPGPFVESLAGGAPSASLTVTWTDVVVLSIPAKGAKGTDGQPLPVTVLGSQLSATAAEKA
jgi:hypothetical protein